MDPLAFAIHLLSFAAPAFAVALLVTLAARLVLPRGSGPARWWLPFVLNFVAGLLILAGGLWHFGRDGKMMTYAVLVVGVATCQWLVGRGWRA